MERTYERSAALVGRATGPLASHLGLFVASLIDQQYTANVIAIKVRHALAFDRWLAERRVAPADLGEVHIERYQRRERRRHRRLASRPRRLTIWRPFMRNIFKIGRGWRPRPSSATQPLPGSFSKSVSEGMPSICAWCVPAM
jgi:hypothetical protein